MSRLSDPQSARQIAEVGAYLAARLELLPKWFPEIVKPQIRGRGLILGIGLHDQKNPAIVVNLARERGLLILTAGDDALRLVPSLNIERGNVDQAMGILESCLVTMRAK